VRQRADADRIRALARELGRRADQDTNDVHHFDPYSQALSKVERGFEQDLEDVRQMLERGW
jgi:hypothetical protein